MLLSPNPEWAIDGALRQSPALRTLEIVSAISRRGSCSRTPNLSKSAPAPFVARGDERHERRHDDRVECGPESSCVAQIFRPMSRTAIALCAIASPLFGLIVYSPFSGFDFPSIAVRDFAALRLAEALGLPGGRPDKSWTTHQWAAFRAEVSRARMREQ